MTGARWLAALTLLPLLMAAAPARRKGGLDLPAQRRWGNSEIQSRLTEILQPLEGKVPAADLDMLRQGFRLAERRPELTDEDAARRLDATAYRPLLTQMVDHLEQSRQITGGGRALELALRKVSRIRNQKRISWRALQVAMSAAVAGLSGVDLELWKAKAGHPYYDTSHSLPLHAALFRDQGEIKVRDLNRAAALGQGLVGVFGPRSDIANPLHLFAGHDINHFVGQLHWLSRPGRNLDKELDALEARVQLLVRVEQTQETLPERQARLLDWGLHYTIHEVDLPGFGSPDHRYVPLEPEALIDAWRPGQTLHLYHRADGTIPQGLYRFFGTHEGRSVFDERPSQEEADATVALLRQIVDETLKEQPQPRP